MTMMMVFESDPPNTEALCDDLCCTSHNIEIDSVCQYGAYSVAREHFLYIQADAPSKDSQFFLTAKHFHVPENDDCSHAYPLPPDGIFSRATHGATSDQIPQECGSPYIPGVWYTI
jgi:hypothetical protein